MVSAFPLSRDIFAYTSPTAHIVSLYIVQRIVNSSVELLHSKVWPCGCGLEWNWLVHNLGAGSGQDIYRTRELTSPQQLCVSISTEISWLKFDLWTKSVYPRDLEFLSWWPQYLNSYLLQERIPPTTKYHEEPRFRDDQLKCHLMDYPRFNDIAPVAMYAASITSSHRPAFLVKAFQCIPSWRRHLTMS